MDFKLNRRNRILEVTLKSLEDEAAVPITFPKMELNQSYVPVVEEILTGAKSCSDHEYIMVDEIIVEEAVYQTLQSGAVYEMTGSGLTVDDMNIYCFDLLFGKVSVEKIGNKKKVNGKMVLKHVKIRLWPDGAYSAKEASGLLAEKTKDSNVSVSLGDQVAAFQGI